MNDILKNTFSLLMIAGSTCIFPSCSIAEPDNSPRNEKQSILPTLQLLLTPKQKVEVVVNSSGDTVLIVSVEKSSLGEIQTSLLKKDDGSVDVVSEVTPNTGKMIRFEFSAENPGIMQEQTDDDIRISIAKVGDKYHVTIPKELMSSWNNSGVIVSSGETTVPTDSMIVIKDDPVIGWYFGEPPPQTLSTIPGMQEYCVAYRHFYKGLTREELDINKFTWDFGDGTVYSEVLPNYIDPYTNIGCSEKGAILYDWQKLYDTDTTCTFYQCHTFKDSGNYTITFKLETNSQTILLDTNPYPLRVTSPEFRDQSYASEGSTLIPTFLSYSLSVSPSSDETNCISNGNYWTNGNCLSSVPVVISAGQVWMDRNLGASRVAINPTDTEAYGDLYQWGRFRDGHEKRSSSAIPTLSSSATPNHSSFIKSTSFPYDWIIPQNNSLWQEDSEKNNPCPPGFRLPTETEMNTERASWSSNDADGAFASPLKLVWAGMRNGYTGTITDPASTSYYWTNTVIEGVASARGLSLGEGQSYISYGSRATGASVRCILD